MSTLTKVLIIVLSVSSIFLCGIVATYVGSASDYKERYETVNAQLGKAKADVREMEAEVRTILLVGPNEPDQVYTLD